MERPNAWLTYSDADMKDLETVAKKYRHFLNVGKTERECITQIVKEAEEAGYVSFEEKVKNGEDLKAGDKVYQVKSYRQIGFLAQIFCRAVQHFALPFLIWQLDLKHHKAIASCQKICR